MNERNPDKKLAIQVSASQDGSRLSEAQYDYEYSGVAQVEGNADAYVATVVGLSHIGKEDVRSCAFSRKIIVIR